MANKTTELRVFRGQHGIGSNILRTRLGSLTFTNRHIATHYAHNPNESGDNTVDPVIFEATISFKNPFVNTPNDAFVDISELIHKLGVSETHKLIKQFDTEIMSTNAWQQLCIESGVEWSNPTELLNSDNHLIESLCIQLYHLFDDVGFVALLKEKGYDVAIYRGSGIGSESFELRVIDEATIINLTWHGCNNNEIT